MHVLIVEDNTLVARGIKAGLELHGMTCDIAMHIAQAQLLMAACQFDVCVLDLGLPDGDGRGGFRFLISRLASFVAL